MVSVLIGFCHSLHGELAFDRNRLVLAMRYNVKGISNLEFSYVLDGICVMILKVNPATFCSAIFYISLFTQSLNIHTNSAKIE